MSYNFITEYDSPNCGQIYDPLALPCHKLTIHWWDDPNKHPQPYSVINTLCSPTRQASAHAVIWPGNVACLVNYDQAAWHCGNTTGNQTSIGLELCPNDIEATLDTATEYIADLIKQGVLAENFEIYGHMDWSSTDCPGAYYPRLAEIRSRAITIAGGNPAPATPAPASAPSGDIESLARAVIRGDYGNGDERERRLGSRYAEVQARVNEILGTSSSPAAPSGDIESLARAVIRGDYGNGDERRRRLGERYAAVQARVNEILGW